MNSIFYPLKTKFLGACIDLVRSWYGASLVAVELNHGP